MLGVFRWIIHQTSATPLCAANAHNKSVCVCMRGVHSLERGRLNFWREWIWERDCVRAQCRLSPRWWCVTTAGLFADLILGVGFGWGLCWQGGVCVWSPSEPLCQALISLVVPAVSLMNFLEYPKARKAQLLFHNASVTIFFNKHQTCFCLLVAFSLYAQLYSSLSICQSILFVKSHFFFVHAYTNTYEHTQTVLMLAHSFSDLFFVE